MTREICFRFQPFPHQLIIMRNQADDCWCLCCRCWLSRAAKWTNKQNWRLIFAFLPPLLQMFSPLPLSLRDFREDFSAPKITFVDVVVVAVASPREKLIIRRSVRMGKLHESATFRDEMSGGQGWWGLSRQFRKIICDQVKLAHPHG